MEVIGDWEVGIGDWVFKGRSTKGETKDFGRERLKDKEKTKIMAKRSGEKTKGKSFLSTRVLYNSLDAFVYRH